VAFLYEPPPGSGEMRQGEIISGVFELQPRRAPIAISEGDEVTVEPIIHHRMMVMTADCDLLQDFGARQSNKNSVGDLGIEQLISNLLPAILLCDLYIQEELQSRVAPGTDIWKRIAGNSDERYHHLDASQISGVSGEGLPHLFMDFKKILAISGHWLYQGLEAPNDAKIERIAIVPPIYLQRLMHRFFSFQSRIGNPD